jgi:RNA polymerase sigma-70 factor (ECF subfamily)
MRESHERVIDELLVTRCQAGDAESFDLLIRRWQRRLWRYARTLTGNNDAAWDITQEAWFGVLGQIRKLRDPAWFAAWAHRIVRNKYADYCRRATRREKLVDELANLKRPNKDRPTESRSEAVAEAVGRLPLDSQELLTLKYVADLSIIEIAVILGIPAGTVKSRLHHARERLRKTLEGDES